MVNGEQMNIILLGPPNVGKGTYAGHIEKRYSIPKISTGDIFRENIAKKTGLGAEANNYISKGLLVPDETTINMLLDRLKKSDTKNGFILDGFPRTTKQAEALEKNNIKITVVVNLRASEKVLIDRVSGRRTCESCGAIYHIRNVPPKKPGVCDKCGGKLVQREDAKPEIFKERLRVYKEQTSPLIEYYKKRKLLVDIDANRELGEIVESVFKVLDRLK